MANTQDRVIVHTVRNHYKCPSHVVYKARCNNCKIKHVGETTRTLKQEWGNIGTKQKCQNQPGILNQTQTMTSLSNHYTLLILLFIGKWLRLSLLQPSNRNQISKWNHTNLEVCIHLIMQIAKLLNKAQPFQFLIPYFAVYKSTPHFAAKKVQVLEFPV